MGRPAEQLGHLTKVKDELAWELLRDEWELLMAVGTGPSSAEKVSRKLNLACAKAVERLEVLVDYGLVNQSEGGYSLVSAFHQRQESMASYVKELVLDRIQLAGAPPLAARVRFDLSTSEALRPLLARAEKDIFPWIADAANVTENNLSERFLLVLAVSANCPSVPEASQGDEIGPDEGNTVSEVLRVIRHAAMDRSREVTAGDAKLWVAEMCVEPGILNEIIECVEEFVNSPTQGKGDGALAFAVWPVARRASLDGGE
jgi:hypothetical protein